MSESRQPNVVLICTDQWRGDCLGSADHCNSYTPHPWPLDERLHPTAWVSTMGADFLRRHDTTRPPWSGCGPG